VAPGNLLVSTETPNTTLYRTEPGNQVLYSSYIYGGSSSSSKFYFTLSGTSMAAGIVSGVVADLLQAHPQMTPDQVKARLMKTAYKTFPATSSVYDAATGTTYNSQYDVFTIGAGYVDLAAALASNDLAQGTALSPTAVYDSNTGNVYMSSDQSSVWGSSAVWSGPAVWGKSQFTGGSSVMWGATTTGGSSVMWGATNAGGSSVMWGATGLWGSSVMWGATGFSAVWGSSVMWGADSPWGSSVMWGAGTDKGE
jgi:serine protease AprX